MDGTLSNIDHRIHHLLDGRKEYSECNAKIIDDTPNIMLCELARMYATSGFNIVICTGRFKKYRKVTMDQLRLWAVPWHQLFMREDDDYQSDAPLKKSFIGEIPCPVLVFEDRDSVVAMWRKEGIQTFQVAKGEY